MDCFKKNNDIVEKYNVIFDVKELEDLKTRIINDCSLIRHFEFESEYAPSFKNMDYIRDFKYTFIGEKEYFDDKKDIYAYSYNEIEPPYLVELINMLLKGNINVINKILNYDTSTALTLEDKIIKLKQEISELLDKKNLDYIRKQKEQELKRLINSKELNKNQKPIDSYYKELLGLIRFELIDIISIEELTKVESFLGLTLIDNNKLILKNEKDKQLILKKH